MIRAPPPSSLLSLMVRTAASAPNGGEGGVSSGNGQGTEDEGRQQAKQCWEEQERRRDDAMCALMQEQHALKLKVDALLAEKTETNAKLDSILQLLHGERERERFVTRMPDSFRRVVPGRTEGTVSLQIAEGADGVNPESFVKARKAFSSRDSPRKRRSRSRCEEHGTLVMEQGVGFFVRQVLPTSPTSSEKVLL